MSDDTNAPSHPVPAADGRSDPLWTEDVREEEAALPTGHANSQWRRATMVNARLDALPGFGLAWSGRIALLFLFFFASWDAAVFPLTIPAIAAEMNVTGVDLGWPVAANLAAYAVGAYLVGWIADRYGRQSGLLLTALILGVGNLLTALSWDIGSFTWFRFITGAGMGAVLSLGTAYLGELAPKGKRGRTISILFFVQAFLLMGMSFLAVPVVAIADGWRWLYAIGLASTLVIATFRRTGMMESPRWLAERGQLDRAEELVELIEQRMEVQGPPPEIPAAPDLLDARKQSPLRELLRPPLLRRIVISIVFWFLYYLAFYGFSSYRPIILEGLGSSMSDAIFVTALTSVMGPLACVALFLLIERMERRTMIIVGCVMQAAALLLMLSGMGVWTITVANLVYTFMTTVVSPPAFTYTAEIFPTRARGTAAAIGDGIGHLGGALAPFIVLPIFTATGSVWTVVAVIGALIGAAIAVGLGPRTKNRALTDIAA